MRGISVPRNPNRALVKPFQAARHISPFARGTTPRISSLHHFQQFRLLSNETRKTIEGILSTAPVVLFMKGTPQMPECGFSRASLQILGLQGVDPKKFVAYNVLQNQEIREGLGLSPCPIALLTFNCFEIVKRGLTKYDAGIKEYSNWPTIPQLYINREFIGGCDILVSMHKNGDLAKLLDEKMLLIPEDEAAEEEVEPKGP